MLHIVFCNDFNEFGRKDYVKKKKKKLNAFYIHYVPNIIICYDFNEFARRDYVKNNILNAFYIHYVNDIINNNVINYYINWVCFHTSRVGSLFK